MANEEIAASSEKHGRRTTEKNEEADGVGLEKLVFGDQQFLQCADNEEVIYISYDNEFIVFTVLMSELRV